MTALFVGCGEPAFAMGDARGVAFVLRGFVSQNGLLLRLSRRPLLGVRCAGEPGSGAAPEAAFSAGESVCGAVATEAI